MIGYGALFLALVMTCIAAFFYFHNHMAELTKSSSKKSQGGRKFYDVAAGCIGIAALYLLYIILTNQFQFMYVAGYSSTDLPLAYKLSVFWAGQEGSFMLWLVFHVIFGGILSRKAAPGVMVVYSALQAILLMILLAKSPFMMLAQPRVEGFGLNPLLQDPWMVIHPPILFLGYAGLAVPFSYAMHGLMSKEHKSWLSAALPWTLFSSGTLGAGIFIGGFWAYKVLGWGGYWAWDPVENSSLVPWLIAGVLVHTIVLAKNRDAGISLAYFSAIFSFVSVLYGTFLTRSGILSNFSTHSFSDEGIGSVLAGFVLITLFVSLGLYIIRLPNLPQGELTSKLISKESVLLATSLVLGVLSVFVFIGMSTPLITMMIGNPQSLQISFYNAVSLPLGICLMILLAALPVVYTASRKKVWVLAGIIVISFCFAFLYGIKQPLILLAMSFACGAVVSNTWMGYKKVVSTGAAITHVGLAVLVMGIVISSSQNQSAHLNFKQTEAQQVFGYDLTYLGEEKTADGSGIYQNFIAAHAGDQVELKAYTKLNKEGNPAAREPAIYRTLFSDLYIAPSPESEAPQFKQVALHEGESMEVDELQVTFLKLVIQGMGSNDVRVAAQLEIGKAGETVQVAPEMSYRNGHIHSQPIVIFGQYEFTLYTVNPNDQSVIFAYRDTLSDDQKQTMQAEISYKPFINLVWLGTFLITVGTILASLKRFAR